LNYYWSIDGSRRVWPTGEVRFDFQQEQQILFLLQVVNVGSEAYTVSCSRDIGVSFGGGEVAGA